MESKIIFGQMIDYFRREKGLTMEELGNELGKAKSSISRWISGERYPKIEEIEEIAIYFNTDVETLIFGGQHSTSTLTLITETSAKLNEDRQLNVLDYAEDQLNEQNRIVNIDEINEELYPYEVTEKLAAASDLPNGFNYDADNNRKFTLYSDKLTTKQYDIASQVTGDSMEPLYHDGDVVLIQKGYDNINGAIYAVDYDGKTYLKKVFLEDNKFRLVSINDKYDDIIIDIPVDEEIYFNIVGKVVDSFTPVEV